jgi:hypothetical protein
MSTPSREPRRWLETEDDDWLEALRPSLSSQRSAGPDPSARERIWRELGPRLPPATQPAQNAGSACPAVEHPLPPAPQLSTARRYWLQVAAGLGLIAGALAVWAAWDGLAPKSPSARRADAAEPGCATCEARAAPPSAASMPAEETTQSARPRRQPASSEPTTEPAPGELARVEPARAKRVVTTPPQARRRPPASAPPRAASTTPGPTDVRSELELLARARRVLAADPGRALALTAEHARQHREGVLSQEREVLAIEALVRLGRRELAASRAGRFLEDHPESAHRVRLAAVLEEP